MLQLQFSTEDLLRVRFAAGPAPLVEAGLALAVVRAGSADPAMARWRHATSARLGSPARRLLELLRPDTGLGPLFLDPPLLDPADAVDRVTQTPREEAAAELRRVAAGQPVVSSWAVGLSRGEARAWRELRDSLTAVNSSLLRPWTPRLRAGFDADIAWRTRTMATTGLRETLTGLIPGSSWAGQVLRVPGKRNRQIRLTGRGVTLLPTLFWRGAPLHDWHPDGSLLIVYPALTPFPLLPGPEAAADPLAALLGPTRAEVLQLLAQPRTTGEVARLLGISPASASGHAGTLRAAGLVTSAREGKHVRHICTSLGVRLLAGG